VGCAISNAIASSDIASSSLRSKLNSVETSSRSATGEFCGSKSEAIAISGTKASAWLAKLSSSKLLANSALSS